MPTVPTRSAQNSRVPYDWGLMLHGSLPSSSTIADCSLANESTTIQSPSIHTYIHANLRIFNKKLRCCCDSRSYCVLCIRCTGKLLNRFRLQVYERLVRTIRFNGKSLWTHPNSIHSSVTNPSSRSQWITERNTNSARLIDCLKKTHVRISFDSFFHYVWWLNYTSYNKSVGRDK